MVWAKSRQVGMSQAHPSFHRFAAITALAEGRTLSSTLRFRANSLSPSLAVNQNDVPDSSKKRSIAVAISARASSRHFGAKVV